MAAFGAHARVAARKFGASLAGQLEVERHHMKRDTTFATNAMPSEQEAESDERAFQKLKQMLQEAFAVPSSESVILTADMVIARNRKA